jgi:hypothetical protein
MPECQQAAERIQSPTQCITTHPRPNRRDELTAFLSALGRGVTKDVPSVLYLKSALGGLSRSLTDSALHSFQGPHRWWKLALFAVLFVLPGGSVGVAILAWIEHRRGRKGSKSTSVELAAGPVRRRSTRFHSVALKAGTAAHRIRAGAMLRGPCLPPPTIQGFLADASTHGIGTRISPLFVYGAASSDTAFWIEASASDDCAFKIAATRTPPRIRTSKGVSGARMRNV